MGSEMCIRDSAPVERYVQTLQALQADPDTGTVRLKLFKGGITVSGRKSPYSLYNAEQSSFETRMSIDASDSGGFINVNGLRLSTWSAVWPRL